MKVVSVKINNILSIENAELSFEDSGLVLIEGWNYDDNRATGAGKTAIFNALCFGLYGKLPRKITASEVLRNGTKKGFVSVDVQVGSRLLTVKRERPNKLTFSESGSQLEIGQEEFESLIKLSYDQFLMSMYTAQGGANRFIGKNDVEKKDFLLQLMNLNEFNACKKEAESAIKAYEKEISDLENKKAIFISQIEVLEAVSVDVNINLKHIEQYRQRIAGFNKQIIELQSISQPDLSKYAKLETDIRNKQKQFAEARAKKTMLHQQYKQLSLQDIPFSAPKPDANCPHCEGELNIRGKSVVKADDKVALRQQHEEHMQQIKSELSTIKQQIDECDSVLVGENKILNLQAQLATKKEEEYSDYNNAVRKIADLKANIRSDEIQIQAKENENLKQKDLVEKVDKYNKSIEKIDKEIKSKKIEVELLEAVSSVYSSTGAQAYVVDYIVDSFNEAVAEYVDLIWPNASYKLNAYKEKKDGDVVAKFSETLIINGKEKSIGMLSGGEFRAISLVIDFAIINMLSRQFGMQLNPIILDEPFDGLDAVGREIVIGLLEKLSLEHQICVIDHASEAKAMFSKIIKVEKRQDVSRIVETA